MSVIQRTKLEEGVAVDVTKAKYLTDYKIRLSFSDGFERDIDLGPFLRAASHPEITKHLDPAKFAQFKLTDGELIWGDYELCFPIADLYEGSI